MWRSVCTMLQGVCMYRASVCGLSSGCVDYPSGCIYHLRVLFPFCPKFLFLYPLVFFTSFFFFFSFSHFHFIFSITTFTHVPRPNSQETDQQGPESVTDSGIRPGVETMEPSTRTCHSQLAAQNSVSRSS